MSSSDTGIDAPSAAATQGSSNTKSTLEPSWFDNIDVFDIREKIHSSPYTGCARESFLWSIATGTAMGLHRLRMGSRNLFSTNVAFGTAMLVCVPSYYFCVKRLEHKDKVVKVMMKANEFDSMEDAPDTPDIEDHPFLEKSTEGTEGLDKAFEAYADEPKPWQKQQVPKFEEVGKK
mmetsp:Transcript_53809/g.64937  ORF Transcript_53809/g.64937 Transcript_53809/m.64937 type:complete len:176 (+) Transcript_53809:177-704(+)|eukprot:CAMPEP_0172515766 /NCGR_PEP_ID=MMETSP1066-20121228/270376_1 /TAXON_ID=671091 /ORGANISM="Coscinodiscus wailesii, Strain CCMP2513" /LENGTH=175 /DNA_ID=CAMNT_0013296935 /DNA_START=161 /DNA_END=688 /DNA_ORIENTATION=-